MIDWGTRIHRKLRADHDTDSHTEPDTTTFHPSALSRCERQCTISKLGLDDHGVNTLMNFYLGQRQHEDLQAWFEDPIPGVEFEKELKHFEPHRMSEMSLETELTFTGHCDVYDPVDDAIYDFKTRKSWKGFDGASDAHKDQLTTYMKMAGVERGQLVYLVKSAPWDETEDVVKTWPSDGWFKFDEERWQGVLMRARRIHDGLRKFEEETGRLPMTVGEVPFEGCGCWLCRSTGESDASGDSE